MRRTGRPLFAANWKMNLLSGDAQAYCRTLAAGLQAQGARGEVLLLPPYPLLPVVASALRSSDPPSGVALGGQDLHPEDAGAHTGDVSGPMLRDAGCAFALCGHSERRRDHGEQDALIAKKLAAAVRAGLIPLLCLGETLGEREAGETDAVLERQLSVALSLVGASSLDGGLALAYEPVWAIGTGRSATPTLVQAAHAFLRRLLQARAAAPAATSIRILYGGSVGPENCEALFRQADVDGFLIGGAALDPGRFLDIIRRCDASSEP